MKKHINIKLILMFVLTLSVFIIGLFWFITTIVFRDAFSIAVSLFLIFISIFIIVLYVKQEAFCYAIDEDGIKWFFGYKTVALKWKDIKSISEKYDIFFGNLFMKNYIIKTTDKTYTIVKYSSIKKALEMYGRNNT